MNGALIVLEGIDGAGTTTHATLLADALKASGLDVCLTCEPTRGPIGRLIREILQGRVLDSHGRPRPFDWATLGLLFAADRLDHNAATVLPALEAGRIVVSDRYDLSSLIYQSSVAPDEARARRWLVSLNQRARRPDLVIVLDVPADVAESRRRLRSSAPELFDTRALQERLTAVYARAETICEGDRIVHVSGVGAPGEVAKRIWQELMAAELPALVQLCAGASAT